MLGSTIGSTMAIRRERSRLRPKALAAVTGLLLASAAARAQDAADACASSIRALIADIALRDLDTSQGPPLNAFLTLNPNAVAQAAALDRSRAALATPDSIRGGGTTAFTRVFRRAMRGHSTSARAGHSPEEGSSARAAPRWPLFCVPVAVKDNFDTYDMPTTVGSLALIGNQPPRDAAFVARLRQAGAIIVGKTNMDEFAMGVRGLSGAGGRVGNAYDTAKSAGGSSAGSGAAVGAGFVPFALGSDNCGSLRIPAAANGAVSLRATYGRFDTGGIFPIGFVNGVPGVIARDTATLRTALAVVGDGWRDELTADGSLRGKRIGMLRRLDGKDPWAGAAADTQKVFAQALALFRDAGAEIVDGIALDDFNVKLGPGFLKGFAAKVDAAFATFPAARKSWADVCSSGRIRVEWSGRQCNAAAASSPSLERQALAQIAGNQRTTIAALDRARLDALIHPIEDTCFIAGASGLPAAAFPVGLNAQGLPVGVELLGRPQADESLVAMMAAFEAVRGPFPKPKPIPARADLAALDIPRQNELRLRLGWSAFRSRHGEELGALAPEKFRALTQEVVQDAVVQAAVGKQH
jgi:amidase